MTKKYREPTEADIGKIVEAREGFTNFRSGKLLGILSNNSYSFVVETDNRIPIGYMIARIEEEEKKTEFESKYYDICKEDPDVFELKDYLKKEGNIFLGKILLDIEKRIWELENEK